MKFEFFFHGDKGYKSVSEGHGPIMLQFFRKFQLVVFKYLGGAYKNKAWRYRYENLANFQKGWHGGVETRQEPLFSDTFWRFLKFSKEEKGPQFINLEKKIFSQHLTSSKIQTNLYWRSFS